MVSHLEMCLSRLRRRLSTVELVYTSHERWPLPRLPFPGERLNISVLDSSFNPPTLAHLALANTPFPASFRNASSDNDVFHAKLLLLSVRNVDKSLKPSDATYAQRLEMMISLIKDITPDGTPTSRNKGCRDEIEVSPPDEANVAVGIIDEPTFVGKSQVLLEFLRGRLQAFPLTEGGIVHSPKPKLTFLVGTDTLGRLFAPRYYSSEQAMQQSLQSFFTSKDDGSRILCGRRATSGSEVTDEEEEQRVASLAKEYIESSHIALVDLDESIRSLSSSEVRRLISNKEIAWSSAVARDVAGYITQHSLYQRM